MNTTTILDEIKKAEPKLSLELQYMISQMIEEDDSKCITSEALLEFCFSHKDSILHNSIKTFLTTDEINKVDGELKELSDVASFKVRPNTPYHKSFITNLNKIGSHINDYSNCPLITSIAFAIYMADNNKDVHKIFVDNAISSDFLRIQYVEDITPDDVIEATDVMTDNALQDNQNPDTSDEYSDLSTLFNEQIINEIPMFDELLESGCVNVKIVDASGAIKNLEDSEVRRLLDKNKQMKKEKQKKTKNDSIPFCTNLNELATSSTFDPITGRDNEILDIEKAFNRRKCNNVIIVGKNGTGKTALINGLAYNIATKKGPLSLINHTVYKLDLSGIVAGTTLRGMFEERISKTFNALSSKKNSIVFIDDISIIANEKKKEEYDIIGNIMKYIDNDNLKIIISANEQDYKSLVSANPVIKRSFYKIQLKPSNVEDSIKILNTIKHNYETYHNVLYSKSAIETCVKLANRYITDDNLPSSAINLLDESGASKKLSLLNESDLLNNITMEENLMTLKESMLKENTSNIEDIESIDREIDYLRVVKNDIIEQLDSIGDSEKTVTEDDIYEAVSRHTNIPVSKLSLNDKKRLLTINDTLKKSVIGQDSAIDDICNAIKRNKVGLYPQNRPIYSAMFIGNSGVGKTLVAKKLASEIFGDEKFLVRFDMSEYADKTSINKLIGSSAGYVGYEKGGLLTEAIKNNSYCVLLIDEIEKANEEVYNLFLQILDEGFLTDNTGNKVDFKNTIILLTSNVGAKKASNSSVIGFNPNQNLNKKDIIEKELKNKFPPEFINRLDDVVYFNDLNEENLKKIIGLEMDKLNDRLNAIGYQINCDRATLIDYLYKFITNDNKYGARPIIRIIQREIENRISDFILLNDETENKSFNLSVVNDAIVVS